MTNPRLTGKAKARKKITAPRDTPLQPFSCLGQSVLVTRLYSVTPVHQLAFNCWNCLFLTVPVSMSQRRHCWKCGSRHPKPTGFKCKRTLPNMNSANIASTIGSTTWSTLGANMTTAGSTYTVTSPSHTVTLLGSTFTTTVVTMATSDTVFRSTHDTMSSFAAGTNTAPMLTTATTTFNFSLPQNVLCTATSTRPSAPMPSPSTFNPSAPKVQTLAPTQFQQHQIRHRVWFQ